VLFLIFFIEVAKDVVEGAVLYPGVSIKKLLYGIN